MKSRINYDFGRMVVPLTTSAWSANFYRMHLQDMLSEPIQLCYGLLGRLTWALLIISYWLVWSQSFIVTQCLSQAVDDLRVAIEGCFVKVAHIHLLNVQKEMLGHWNYCMMTKGGTFEHQLCSTLSCFLFALFLIWSVIFLFLFIVVLFCILFFNFFWIIRSFSFLLFDLFLYWYFICTPTLLKKKPSVMWFSITHAVHYALFHWCTESCNTGKFFIESYIAWLNTLPCINNN